MADLYRPLIPEDIFTGQRVQFRSLIQGEVTAQASDGLDDKLVTITVEGGPRDGLSVQVWCPNDESRVPDSGVELLEAIDEPVTEGDGAWCVRAPIDGPNETDQSKWIYIGAGKFLCWQSGISSPPDGGATFVVGAVATLEDIWPLRIGLPV